LSITDYQGPRPVPDDYRPEPPAVRTPPQDEQAEQSVIGAMLLSKDAIADVVEIVRGADFYRPAHELMFNAILDLYSRGEPADAITVAAELTRAGDLARVGGAPYLHTLVAGVPVAANAGYYASIVREKAILRRLVNAGTKIVQIGYAGEGDVDDVVDRAQAEVYGVTDKRTSEDYAPLSDLMEMTVDELEAIANRDGAMAGVPTGFAELDELTNGLHGGQMVIVAARPAVGKALALDTPLPTPTGWTTMGAVQVGDELIGADGQPTRVVAATAVLGGRPCHRLTFSDETTIVADAEHQWLTETSFPRSCEEEATRHRSGHRNGTLSVKTTAQIAASSCLDSALRPQHAVVNAQPVQLPTRRFAISPYALGVRLAHRHRAGTLSAALDPEISMLIEGDEQLVEQQPTTSSTDPLVEGGSPTTAQVGVNEPLDDAIPAPYLRASEDQRRQLLAGLLDENGVVAYRGGSVQLALTSERLAEDAYELVVSLGYGCRLQHDRADDRSGAITSVLTFSACDDVFRLPSKALLHKNLRPDNPLRTHRRYIELIDRVEPVPVRCVEVDSDDHLYLAGKAMVPTHNSTLGLDLARSAAIRHQLPSVIFSLEMSRTEITMRLLSAEGRIPLHHMRNGKMSDDEWTKLARKTGEISSAPLFIDDSPNLTMMEIRAKSRRLKQRHDLRLIVIDYLQLMTSGKKVESRQLEVSEFSRQIKLLAKELDVPVVAICQLNRGSEQRTSKRPLLSDLRESGSLEQDADMVILLHREDMYEKESPRAGEADIIVAKHRNGPTADLLLSFQGHYSRFTDMAH